MTNYSCIFFSRGMHVLSGKSRIALSKMYANFKKDYKAGLLILHYYLKHEIKIIKVTRGDTNRGSTETLILT